MSSEAPEKDAWLKGSLINPADKNVWVTGILKSWKPTNGYGHFERDDGLPDVFVHLRAVLLADVDHVKNYVGKQAKIIVELAPDGIHKGEPRARRIIFSQEPHV